MNKPPRKRNKTTSAASTDSTSATSSANEDISQQVDPGSATITVTAVEVPELTEQEISDRLLLERKVERAFLRQARHWLSCAIAGYTDPLIAHLRSIVVIDLDTPIAESII